MTAEAGKSHELPRASWRAGRAVGSHPSSAAEDPRHSSKTGPGQILPLPLSPIQTSHPGEGNLLFPVCTFRC